MFSGDARKALKNFKKHGVPFEEAATVFGDSAALDYEDIEHSFDERRWVRIGMSARARVLAVAYTLRSSNDGTETIRIISARQADDKEREAYAG